MTLKKLIGAILLSFLVIPGSGHASVKKKLRGLFWGAGVIIVLVVLFFHVMFLASSMMQAHPITPGHVDVIALSQSMTGNVMAELSGWLKLYTALLCVFYFGSVIDLIWIYKKNSRAVEQ